MFVFYFFMDKASQETFLPLLIWSYGVASGPWRSLAQNLMPEKSWGYVSNAPGVTMFIAQIAYVIVGLIVIFVNATWIASATIFGSIILIGIVIQTITTIIALRNEKFDLEWAPKDIPSLLADGIELSDREDGEH